MTEDGCVKGFVMSHKDSAPAVIAKLDHINFAYVNCAEKCRREKAHCDMFQYGIIKWQCVGGNCQNCKNCNQFDKWERSILDTKNSYEYCSLAGIQNNSDVVVGWDRVCVKGKNYFIPNVYLMNKGVTPIPRAILISLSIILQ